MVTLSNAGNANKSLFLINQGACLVAEYAVDFWTLAFDAGWNEPALQGAFHWGLSASIWSLLALKSRPRNRNELVATAIECENHLRDQQRE